MNTRDMPEFLQLVARVAQSLIDAIVGMFIQQSNRVVSLGWGGYVETDIQFADFATDSHTLTIRFLPQYLYAYTGPLVTDQTTDAYLVGVGDFRWGNGSWKVAGDPVFFVKIGGTTVRYLATGLDQNHWHHLALTLENDGSDFELSLYLDGNLLTPYALGNTIGPVATPVIVAGSDLAKVGGPILLGGGSQPINFTLTGSANSAGNSPTQFYGMIDDLGVFKIAITGNSVANLMKGINGDERLMGNEFGLFAGVNFDSPPLLPGVDHSYTLHGAATLIQIANQRQAADASKIPLPALNVPLRLPFPLNDEWTVGQGGNVNGGSHVGFAAFCWDFDRASGPTQDAPLVAAASGTVHHVRETYPKGSPTGQENVVVVRHAADEFASYLHIATDSFTNEFGWSGGAITYNGTTHPSVGQGDKLCRAGDTGTPGGPHLHFAMLNEPDLGPFPGKVTIPAAFSDFEVWNDGCFNFFKGWRKVKLGIPRTGDRIRRTT